jgi:hypothetical protein
MFLKWASAITKFFKDEELSRETGAVAKRKIATALFFVELAMESPS